MKVKMKMSKEEKAILKAAKKTASLSYQLGVATVSPVTDNVGAVFSFIRLKTVQTLEATKKDK
jgi:hypothetical protein